MRILLVEDEATQRFALEGLLERLGHEPISCDGMSAALDVFDHDSKISLVVSDWNMPAGDGLELCRRLRLRERDAYVYFILLSVNRLTADNQTRAFDAGVDDFLTKPANGDELRLRLHVAERIIRFAGQVRQLESFISICSYCKRVRVDESYWRQLEEYVSSRTGTRFSHGICPSCAEQLRAEIGAPKATGKCDCDHPAPGRHRL